MKYNPGQNVWDTLSFMYRKLQFKLTLPPPGQCWVLLVKHSFSNLAQSMGHIFVLEEGRNLGRDPFNQNSNRCDREKWSTSKGGPVFSKLFRLDRTDPLSFRPKFWKFWLNGSRPLLRPCLWSVFPVACEQALHLGESREVTREQHAKGAANARGFAAHSRVHSR